MKLVLIFTLLFFGFTLSATNEQVTCSGGYVNGNTGHCYKVLKDTKRTWNEAKSECEAQGAELASIQSSQEWQFVKELFKQSGLDDHIFLGGTDAQQEAKWLWTDGSPVTFSDWSPGKPVNGTNWNCMVAWSDGSFRWVDGTCSNTYFAVCKKPESLLDKLRVISSAIEDLKEQNQDLFDELKKLTEKPCLEGWSYYSPTDSCFKILTARFYWDEAKVACASLAQGSSLAKISTAEENYFVIDLMTKGNENFGFWMGANDISNEGSYVWLDGSKVSFADWNSGEPNNWRGNEDCGHWKIPAGWKWNDASCKYRMSSVCQMSASG